VKGWEWNDIFSPGYEDPLRNSSTVLFVFPGLPLKDEIFWILPSSFSGLLSHGIYSVPE
jgi:hypothetical protein